MNIPTSVPPNGGGGLRQRLLRGTLLKWNEVDGYLDRDGVQPVEGPYLLWAIEEGYQRWKDQTVVDEIIDKPLPDLEQLNGAIPKSEWEPGLDGHPRPPYSHQYCFYLLDPNDGQFFTIMNSTVGMKMLWESSPKGGGDAASARCRCYRGGQPRDPAVQDQKWGSSTGPILRSRMAQAGRRWRRQTGWTGCSNTATAPCIIGTIDIIGTAGNVGADIDTGTSTSPDAGCIDFASRSASAATFG
jgi:hypothetical protein